MLQYINKIIILFWSVVSYSSFGLKTQMSSVYQKNPKRTGLTITIYPDETVNMISYLSVVIFQHFTCCISLEITSFLMINSGASAYKCPPL